jgi:hypothetical protein
MRDHLDIKLPAIHSDFQGFSALVNLAARTDDLHYFSIAIDLSACDWLDANMCAPLGALLYRASRRSNLFTFKNIPDPVQRILQKNSFLSYYGHAKKLDNWSTTIQYNRFERKDDRYFGAYIERHFKTKAIPDMSAALCKKFWESIFELFSNAVIHSETEMGIFTCGQYFPKRNRIDFAIADLGIGMRTNLLAKKGLDLPAEEAINWAMEGRNTTKTGPIPGGLGLKLLREFIRLNRGRIQVVSDLGYWEQRYDGEVESRSLVNFFPGTVVNIEINSADTNSYVLSSEQLQDIF